MCVVTIWPGRSTLSYGPASVTTLSPPTATTRTGIGSRLASLIVQPLPSAVAVTTDATTTLSFGPITDLTSQGPATSASLMPPFFAGAGFWGTGALAEPAPRAPAPTRNGRIGKAPPEEDKDGHRG